MCGEVVSRRGKEGRVASFQDLVPGASVGTIGVHWAGVRFGCQCQSSVDSILSSRTNWMAGPVHILDIQIPSSLAILDLRLPRTMACCLGPAVLGGALVSKKCWRRVSPIHQSLQRKMPTFELKTALVLCPLSTRSPPSLTGRLHHHPEASVPHQTLFACTGLTYCSYPRPPLDCSRRG